MDISKLSGGEVAAAVGTQIIPGLTKAEGALEDKVLLQCMLQNTYAAGNGENPVRVRTPQEKQIWNLFLINSRWYKEPGNKFNLQTLFPMGVVVRATELRSPKLMRNTGRLPDGSTVDLSTLLKEYNIVLPITNIYLRGGTINKIKFLGMSASAILDTKAGRILGRRGDVPVFNIVDVFAYSKWWTLSPDSTTGGLSYQEMLTMHPGLTTFRNKYPREVIAQVSALRTGLIEEVQGKESFIHDIGETLARALEFGEVQE